MPADETLLHPIVRDKWRRLAGACALLGHPILLTSTVRRAQEQQELYEQGRSRPGPIVTHARAWESWHQPWIQNEAGHWCGLAFDIAFRPPDDPGTERREDQLDVTWDGPWDVVGTMGEVLGLEWGGRWRGRKQDRPHFQDSMGYTLADLRAARGVTPGEV